MSFFQALNELHYFIVLLEGSYCYDCIEYNCFFLTYGESSAKGWKLLGNVPFSVGHKILLSEKHHPW